MSWYVESLLRNSESIKSGVVGSLVYDGDGDYGESIDLDSDTYNDLLIVEDTVKKLTYSGYLNSTEISIIKLVYNSKSLLQISMELKLSRITVSKIFSKLCDKLAFFLGREFTDEGYLDYMREKYHLTSNEIIKAKNFMASNKRHMIRRKHIE